METRARLDAAGGISGGTTIEPLEARIAPAVITVTNVKDSGDGSLRDAIDEANTTPGEDSIVFASGVAGTIKLKSDLPPITDSVTISGPGASKVKVNGAHHQLLAISGSDLDVSIAGLTLSGGDAVNGGAVYIKNPDGTVTLSALTIKGNRAIGGVIPGEDPGTDQAVVGIGGGVAIVSGQLNIEKSKISGNKAGTVEEIYVGYNKPTKLVFIASGTGGGISVGVDAELSLSKSKVSGNTAAIGGGIHNAGSVSMTDKSVISGNKAMGEAMGGGIFNATDGTIHIETSKISGNKAIGAKGESPLYGGEGGTGGTAMGGGIFNSEGGTIEVIASTISGNKAIGGKGGTGGTGDSGPYASYAGKRGGRGGKGEAGGTGGSAYGGGIANQGIFTIEKSKVSGNSSIGGAGGNGGKGGRGGQGGEGKAAYRDYYGRPHAAKPPGLGGPGGKGGAAGKGGQAQYGGIWDPVGGLTETDSIVSGNTETNGARGKIGATGSPGKTGSTGGGNPYYA